MSVASVGLRDQSPMSADMQASASPTRDHVLPHCKWHTLMPADLDARKRKSLHPVVPERRVHPMSIAVGIICTLIASLACASEADRLDEGVSIQLDDDLFAGQQRDEDYTGGFAIGVSGDRARNAPLSLDFLLGILDQSVLRSDFPHSEHTAHQIGLIAFTPVNVAAAQLIDDDRPYASLLFVANSRISLDADERAAWYTSLSIGALGLPLTSSLHNALHEMVGSPPVRGYDHQISAGGELTGRYVLARHSLLFRNDSGNLEVKSGIQASVGYLTEASASLSLRFGSINSAWWSWVPELTDYIGAPAPTARGTRRPESYLSAGVRLKARAYNAFLQGQIRHSDLRYSPAELEHGLFETWLSFSRDLSARTQLSYTLRYQSAELRRGAASRDAGWAAVQISHSF